MSVSDEVAKKLLDYSNAMALRGIKYAIKYKGKEHTNIEKKERIVKKEPVRTK